MFHPVVVKGGKWCAVDQPRREEEDQEGELPNLSVIKADSDGKRVQYSLLLFDLQRAEASA